MSPREKLFTEQLVRDMFEDAVKEASVVKKEAMIRDVIDRMMENPSTRKVYVTDDDNKLVGMISTETILRLIGYRVGVREGGALSFYKFLRDTLKEKVADVMVAPVSVTMDSRLVDALLLMLERHLNDLPVVDTDGRLLGELYSLELFARARHLFDD